MFPLDTFANNPKYDQKLFFAGTATWQKWEKPLGKAMVYILCIACGGNGAQPTASTTTGGGGGGSGGISTLLIPTYVLPDALYIQVGKIGGTASSLVSVIPASSATNNVLLASPGGNGAASGTAGTAAGAGTLSAGSRLASAGVIQFQGGVIGGAGGAVAVGANVTALGTIFLSGGAGGGGGGNNGGNITGSGNIPTILGGAGSVATNGSPGFTGITLMGGPNGFMACGGSGGGSTTVAADVGGAGGNGGIGCGGGGGGSSTLSTGGAGGLGGPGFVGIWCF